MESARDNILTKKKRYPKVMASPPTSGNLLQHMLWAHLQIMSWKAAVCEGLFERHNKVWMVVSNQNLYTSHC